MESWTLQVEADEINYQEQLFGWPKTKYQSVGQMVNQLEPYLKLWTIVSNFGSSYSKWMGGPFSGLDPEKIEGDVGDMFRNIYKLVRASGPGLTRCRHYSRRGSNTISAWRRR